MDLKLFGEKISILHLIKDPRGLVYSLKKRNKHIQFKGYLSRKCIQWNYKNLLTYLILKNNTNYRLLKYEEIISNPDTSLKNLFRFLNLEFDQYQKEIVVQEQPVFSGNTNFINTYTQIVPKREYIELLSKYEWVKYSILSFPALSIFKYPFRKKTIIS